MASAHRQDSGGGGMNTHVVDGPGFHIRFDDEADYLRAYVFDGTDSLEVSMALWRRLGEECLAGRHKRLLVLEDLASSVAVQDLEPVVDAMFEAGLAQVRVAFIEMRGDFTNHEYCEILCRERGMNKRVFTNEKEAVRWLVFGD
jgi:hypothetical protein